VASRRLVVVAIAAAALVAAAVLLVVGRTTTTVHESTEGAMHAQLVPAQVEFGDELTARIVATVAAKDAGKVHIAQSLAPLTQLGEPALRIEREGSVAVIVQTTRAACLTQACVADSGTSTVKLPSARVTVGASTSSVAWPQLTVQGRVTKAAVAASSTALRADSSPPAVTYRIAPNTLAWLLAAVAALLAALAIAGAGEELMRAAARRRSAVDPLQRALVLAREAERRSPPDRRVALDLLARVLGRTSPDAISETAWSAPEPSPAALSAIVDKIEQERET
jgi:hypothetical protein